MCNRVTPRSQITDEEALPVVYNLLREEGIAVGSSSAINVAGEHASVMVLLQRLMFARW